jgi:hypothetical protein
LGEPVSFWDFAVKSAARQAYVDYVAAHGEALLRHGCIAHYFLKSEADFRRRVERGLAGQFHGQVLYQQLEDNPTLKRELIDKTNMVEDLYLAKYWQTFIESLTLGQPPW